MTRWTAVTRLGVWSEAEREEAAKFTSYRNNLTMLPGDIKYLDVNKDGAITDADRSIIGNGSPKGWGAMTNNVLKAPVSGRVFFLGILQENQFISSNQELFYVAPYNANYFGELHIPQRNAGKVRVGQEVLVKFAGYPYQEFGGVRGCIITIADIPLKDSVFLAKVVLPSGLKTTYGKKLAYKTGMTASADIFTDDSRLFEKLFYQLRKVMNGR